MTQHEDSTGLGMGIRAACLLVHGFGGMPFEMRPLEAALTAAGHVCRVPTLPGHGTDIADFDSRTFEEWEAFVDAQYLELAREHDGPVLLMGLSMGGTLSLSTATRHAPAGVMTIASPLYVYRWRPLEMQDWRLPLVPLLRRLRPIWPMPPRNPEAEAVAPWEGYDGYMALNALHSFLRGIARVRRNLARVSCPVWSIHAPTDSTAPVGSAALIQEGVSSSWKRLDYIEIVEQAAGHHLLTTHRETTDRVQAMAVAFADLAVGGFDSMPSFRVEVPGLDRGRGGA